jgi:hypothetical protein
MTAQSAGTLVSFGAGVYRPAEDSEMCKAWREEAIAWCPPNDKNKKKGEKKNRNFNKRFFENLKKKVPDIDTQLGPEQPIGLLVKGDEAKTLVGAFKDMTGKGDPRAAAVAAVVAGWSALAPRIWGVGKYITGKSMCSALNRKISSLFGSGVTGLHADGMLADGTAVEIKGPGDAEQPNQFKNLKDCSKNGKVLIIDHEACDPGGAICTPQGRCKAPPKP